MDPLCKIGCCFADTIYRKYQNKRYGINFCVDPSEKSIDELADLKDLYDFYQIDGELSCDESTCLTKITEQINLL